MCLHTLLLVCCNRGKVQTCLRNVPLQYTHTAIMQANCTLAFNKKTHLLTFSGRACPTSRMLRTLWLRAPDWSIKPSAALSCSFSRSSRVRASPRTFSRVQAIARRRHSASRNATLNTASAPPSPSPRLLHDPPVASNARNIMRGVYCSESCADG